MPLTKVKFNYKATTEDAKIPTTKVKSSKGKKHKVDFKI